MSEQQTGVGGAEAQKKVEAAWGKFEAELKSYPAAAVAQTERLKVLPALAGSFAEFRRVGGEITGERAVDMEVEVTAGVIDVVEVDTNRAVDDLQVELERPEVKSDSNRTVVLTQGLDLVLQLRDGIGDYVGAARREDFETKTENVKRWLEGRGRVGEKMRRVTRGREAVPPAEPPGPPEVPPPSEGEAGVIGEGGGKNYSSRYWFDELGVDLPENERDRMVAIGEIKWLLGKGVVNVETGKVVGWLERRTREARGEEFDETKEEHLRIARNIAVRAARELFFGHDSETGLAWKTIKKPGSWRGARMDILVPRIREILGLWGEIHGSLVEREVFDMAWVTHEYFFWLRKIQLGQGDIRKQKTLEESMDVDVNHYLTRLVEMIAEEQTVGGEGGWKKNIEDLIEREGVGVREAVERLRVERMELPRFGYIASETDEYGQARVFNLLENRFINVFMKKGEVITVWNEEVGLLEGEELVKLATAKDDAGQFLYEGKSLANVPADVKNRVQQAREAVRKAIEFRGGIGDEGKIPELDEIRVGQAYACKNDGEYLIPMSDWLRQNVAMMRSVFGIPRVYTGGIYDAVLPESILPGGMRIHFKTKRRMPWKNQPPWVRKWKQRMITTIEGEMDNERIDYVESDAELLRDIRGEEGEAGRSRYAKALFDCPQGLTFLEYRRIKDRTAQVMTTVAAYIEDHIRKIQGFRSRIMYDWRLRLGTTWEFPLYDVWQKGVARVKDLFLEEYGIRRDLPARQKRTKKLAEILLRYIYPDLDKPDAEVFREDMFGAWEDEPGIYDEPQLVKLGFSADRAREISRILKPRHEMINLLQQIPTDYWITQKGRIRGSKHVEALKVMMRGPDGMNEINTLLNEKRLAGWVFEQMFEQAGMEAVEWGEILQASPAEKARLYLMLFSREQLFWIFHYDGIERRRVKIKDKNGEEILVGVETPQLDWGPEDWWNMFYVLGTRLENEGEIDKAHVLEQWQKNMDALGRGEKVTWVRGMTRAEAAWFSTKSNRLELMAVDRLQRMKYRVENKGEELVVDGTGNVVGFGRTKRLVVKEPDPSLPADDPKVVAYDNYMFLRGLLLDSRGAIIEGYPRDLDHGLDFPMVHLETAQDLMAIMDYSILQKYGYFDRKNRPLYAIGLLNMDKIMRREYRGVEGDVIEEDVVEGGVSNQIRERRARSYEIQKFAGYFKEEHPNGIEIPEEPQFKFRYADRWSPETKKFEPYLFGQRGGDGKFQGNPVAEYEGPSLEEGRLGWIGGHLGIKLAQGDPLTDWWIAHPRNDWPDTIAGSNVGVRAGAWIRALARFDWHVADVTYGGKYTPQQYAAYILTPADWSALPGDEGRPRWPFEGTTLREIGIWKLKVRLPVEINTGKWLGWLGIRIPGKPKESFFFLARNAKVASEPVIQGLQVVMGYTEEDAKRFDRWRFAEGMPDKEGVVGFEIVREEGPLVVKMIPLVGGPLADVTKRIRWYPKSVLSLPGGLGVVVGTGTGLALVNSLPLLASIPLVAGSIAVAGGIAGLTVGTGIMHGIISLSGSRSTLVIAKRVKDRLWDSFLQPKQVFEQVNEKLIGPRL